MRGLHRDQERTHADRDVVEQVLQPEPQRVGLAEDAGVDVQDVDAAQPLGEVLDGLRKGEKRLP